MKPFPDNKLAISTSCLGLHATHRLDHKLEAAASHGFQGVEIVYNDIHTYATTNKISLKVAALRIRSLCKELKLEILSLCPLENFEGSPTPLKDRLATASEWITLARTLHTGYIQVPAQFGANASGDQEIVVSELRQLCDLASQEQPQISIAYEPMSWSTYYPTWESAIQLANLVDRSNFKICMDTFHIASLLYGDPLSSTGGLRPQGAESLSASLDAFVQNFPKDKLAYVQLSDGERLDPPLSKQHPWYLEGEAACFTWSKWARPFPGETELGGYFPVEKMVKKLVKESGFTGWVSMETFDRRMRKQSYVVEDAANRAARSVEKMSEEVWGSGKSLSKL